MKNLKIIVIVAALFLITVTGYAQEGKVQLVWKNAEDAVMYELEVATVPVTTNQKAPSSQVVYTTTQISTPGKELSLDVFKGINVNKLYYRVRPLDLDKTPIANFSAPVTISSGAFNTQKPTITSLFKKNRPFPLYPVYSWIPVVGAAQYEVEILSHFPENPNGTAASKYRIRSYIETAYGVFDCYDFHAYTEPGSYYWRVIALDENKLPIGTYSDARSFNVQTGSVKWAVFGDSITHGGGAISNPPSDERFEYVSYLPFPVKNLGKSGDTIEMMVERFESDVLPFKPKYMFVMGGNNSIRGGATGESVIASLQAIKNKCEENGITPIFLTLPPINPERIKRVFNEPTADDWQNQMEKVNNFIRNQPNAIETYALLADERGILPVKYGQDGLHPDISGKRIIARSINAFLKDHRFP